MNDSAPRGHDPAKLGRRAGALAYWVLAAFVIVAGIRSVGGQVFFPRMSTETFPGETCEERVAAGRAALEPYGSNRVMSEALTADTLTRWDEAYARLGTLCDSPAYVALGRLRYALESEAQRHERDVTPLLHKVPRPTPSASTNSETSTP